MRSIRFSFAALALVVAAPVAGQAYPSKTVRMIVPTAPGNAADITARLATERLTKRFGQPVIVENRPGGAATGAIAAVTVAKSPADGHTLLFTSTSFTINTAMFAQLPYDVEKDFDAVALTGEVGMVLITAPNSPVSSVQQFVDAVKKDPGRYNYAIVGRGSIQHLTMELFLSAIGGQMVAVPYKGSANAMVDLMSGTIPFMFDALSSATSSVTSGRVKALAVGMTKRAAALPNVPAAAESGVPGLKNFEVIGWVGLVAPKGTPKAIIDTLNENVMRAVQEKDVKEKLATMGVEVPAPHPPERFRDFLRDQVAKWDAAARAAKLPRE
ncbi:MAG: tripartite tricarboxylate transporter substrate binding protein [Alphaproteobacteria bacterium]|nr:tripartite tricarboxylate transporter substrate binding protein [Alphaproteobacteria bacterium]